MAKTKKNPSARKKLLSAIAMLTVSAVTLSTATYAWFTMNKDVEVRGMQLKTKVSGNLLISETNASDDLYGQSLVQGRYGLLEPVSTTTALDDAFWYTVDAKADGSKLHTPSGTEYLFKNYTETGSGTSAALDATQSKKTKYDTEFNSTYNISPSGSDFGTAYGYMDYVFYLKATGDGTDTTIVMDKCQLSYNGHAIAEPAYGSGSGTVGVDLDRAWRVAVFATETERATQSAVPVADGNLKGNILALSDAAYHDSGKAVTAADGGLTAVTFNTGKVVIGTAANTETKYYKVTVRIWLEGQDTTCTSQTYAALTDAWKLDLSFKLDSSDTDAVNSISTGEASTKENDVPDATNTTY
jgi:hypothetical protein